MGKLSGFTTPAFRALGTVQSTLGVGGTTESHNLRSA
jgi:hypothetical protein